MNVMSEKNTPINIIFACLVGSIFLTIVGFLLVILQSCTYSINMVHTQGRAKDVVDEVSTNSPDIKPELCLPLTP